MPLFNVEVVDNRRVLYVVEAEDEEEAERKVEESEDADEEFSGKTLDDAQWYVDAVELSEDQGDHSSGEATPEAV